MEIPSAEQIARLEVPALLLLQVRLRNEIAIFRGDEAHGGGSHIVAIERCRVAGRLVEQQLEKMR